MTKEGVSCWAKRMNIEAVETAIRAKMIIIPESNPNNLVGMKLEKIITKNPTDNTILVIIIGEPIVLNF